jgi:large conductance mechanosensitive channel
MSEETAAVEEKKPAGVKGFLQEFKEFAVKGNAIDMAVGIIVGGAFNKIVTSLVNDIVMPPIGVLLGNVDFTDLKYVLQTAKPAVEEVVDEAGEVVTAAVAEMPEVAIRYGAFCNTIIEFLITALTVFIVVKAATKMAKVRVAAVK